MDNTAQDYWSIVYRQYIKNYWALGGLALSLVFLLIALLAPFLAGRLPLIWLAEHGNNETVNLTFPFWREFFAPAETQEKLLDTFFNYFLALLVVWGILRIFIKKSYKYLILFALLLMIPFLTVKSQNQPTDYLQLQEMGKGKGIFPLLPYSPYQQGDFAPKTPPSWSGNSHSDESNQRYSWLGTDEVGRDVLARLIHGSRVSLAVGFISVGIATIIGLIIGSLAGYYGGWTDVIISRCVEIMMCFPTFFLILTIIAFLDKRSIINIMLVIGFTGWTGTAMIIRGEILKQRKLDYITAIKSLGAENLRIIFRHILPNAIAPVLVGLSFGIAGAISAESGLSFLGLGVASPTATWGELLLEGRDSPLPNWWLSIFPGIAIFLSMTAYNLVGEGLRDAMDPKLRN